MQIKTDWKYRPLLALYEIPEKVRGEFDYVEAYDDTARFVQYKGAWYDTGDVQRIKATDKPYPMGWAVTVHPGSPLALFDSVISETFFSGVLFKHHKEDESVICGSYYV